MKIRSQPRAGGSVVVVAIDTGVDYTNPDIAANMWRNPCIFTNYHDVPWGNRDKVRMKHGNSGPIA